MFNSVDLKQVKLLTRYAMKSEWRLSSLRVVGKKRKLSKWWFVWMIISYLFVGAMLTVVFTKNLHGEAYITALSLVIAYCALVTASNIFLSFGSGFLSPDEAQIISILPVSSETFFVSRLAVVLAYTTVITGAMAIGPSIGLQVLLQPPLHSVGLFIASLLGSYAAAMVVIALYGLVLRKMPRNKLTKILGYVQFAGSLLTTGAFIILPRVQHGIDLSHITLTTHRYLALVPAFWFGSLAAVIGGVGGSMSSMLSAGALLFLGIMSFAAYQLLGTHYQGEVSDLTLSGLTASKEKRLRREPRLMRLYSKMLGTHEARAVLMLFRAQFRYDAKFRLSLVATLPITLVYFVVAIVTGGIVDPFVSSPKEAINAQGFYMVALFMPLILMQSISQSDNYKAAWIFYSSPLDRSRLLLAVRNTLFGWVILPFLLILIGLFTYFMPVLHAVLHVVVLGALATLIQQGAIMFAPKMPFAQRRRPNRNNVATIIGLMLLTGLALALLAVEMIFGYRNDTTFFSTLALILTVCVLMEVVVRARLRKRLELEEFEG